MKKNYLFFILIAFATFVLGCGDTLYKCKITGKVCVKMEEVTYVVQKIDVTLTPQNSKMQYFSTVKTDDAGVFQFDGAYKGTSYKLTVAGRLQDGNEYYGETDFFTVSKDELIQKDIYLEKK